MLPGKADVPSFVHGNALRPAFVPQNEVVKTRRRRRRLPALNKGENKKNCGWEKLLRTRLINGKGLKVKAWENWVVFVSLLSRQQEGGLVGRYGIREMCTKPSPYLSFRIFVARNCFFPDCRGAKRNSSYR